MKECTYGWYPPAKDVWTHYRAKSNTYEDECRYRHHNSRYNSKPGVPTPIPPKHIQLEITPAQPSPRVTSRPPSGPQYVCRNRPTPRKAWTSYVPQTPTSLITPQPPSVSRDTAKPDGTTQQYQHRAQSAHSHRPRTTPKPRPVKSAGPIRSPVTSQQRSVSGRDSRDSRASIKLTKSASMGEIKNPEPDRPILQRPQSCASPERRLTTTPELQDHYYYDNNEEEDGYVNRGVTAEPYTEGGYRADVYTPEAGRSYSGPSTRQWTVYENQLKEHGWRMEIPGDPLNLKKPCITKRLSYTTQVPIAPVASEGPRGHMVNYDTYFYNTIPRRRATFDVAKDWASEVLHAKRMELQKRDGGIKYKYKNFSFVY